MIKSKLEWAVEHAANGFWVFRLKRDGKTPRYKGWQEEATRDLELIRQMWSGRDADCNIGAFTSKFGDNKSLLVVDVDNKNGVCGDDTMFAMDMGDFPFPATAENSTPTGGRHVIYKCDKPVKQGANVLGKGLDTRSRGGYIAMAGSSVGGLYYKWLDAPIADAPSWLYTKLLSATNNASKVVVKSEKVDPVRAEQRAAHILAEADQPVEGERNNAFYILACRLKGAGIPEDRGIDLLVEWNEGLDDPIDEDELTTTVCSAYKTSQEELGADASEVQFEVQPPPENLDPIGAMNAKFAFVIAGGGHHILWETTDERGKFKLEHLNEQSFHKMLAAKTVSFDGKKVQQVSKVWLSDLKCRSYDGLTFMPRKEVDPRFYNMWRGFAYKPIERGEFVDPQWQIGLDQFLEHALNNVCNGDTELFHYLISYLAHAIQKPWEKPLVSLVFKGRKGVGKNAIVERFCALLDPHYLIADDRRYLTGNFNGHLESCLALVLDEATWAGDKEGEGRLKGLITGAYHNIEHKGKEVFRVPNLTRVFVIGNENWLVPATDDERRFAVFNVGAGRQKDRKFFKSMRERMESGGYRLLLTYLENYNIGDLDINEAPMTQGLVDQKHASLEPFPQWWLDCISDGRLIGSAMNITDFKTISTETFRNSFVDYARKRSIRTRLPSEREVEDTLRLIAPSIRKEHARFGGELGQAYVSDGLSQLRRDWDNYIGLKLKWNNFNDGEIECLN